MAEAGMIRDSATLKAALAEQPPMLARALAVRAAMRTLPLMEPWLEWDEEAAMPMVLPTFRPLASAWLAAVAGARHGGELAAAGAAADSGLLATAVEAAVKHATKAVSRATSVVAHTDSRQSFAYARLTFAAAVRAAYALQPRADAPAAVRALAHIGQSIDHWRVIAEDLGVALRAGETADVAAFLLTTPLWPGKTPDWAGHYWASMRERLLTRPVEQWRVWTDWYEARLAPHEAGEVDLEAERRRVLLAEPLWQAGPAHANPEIARRLADGA